VHHFSSSCSVAIWGRPEFIADGVALIQLTDDGKSTPVSWANHADLVAFLREVSGTQSQLLIMNFHGANQETVSPIGNPFFVEWSWAGTELSYEFSNLDERESRGGIFIYDVFAKRTLSVSPPIPEKRSTKTMVRSGRPIYTPLLRNNCE